MSTSPPTVCTDALLTATDALDALSATATTISSTCSTSTCPIPLPTDDSITTPLTTVVTDCDPCTTCATTTSSLTLSSLLKCSTRRVHNVNLPVYDMCQTLFRGPTGTPQLSAEWKTQLDESGITLPRLDALSSTNPSDYWVLREWFHLVCTYATTGQQLNRYDRQNVDRAVSEIRMELDDAEREMDTLYADQRESDRLQAAVDCPAECARAVQEAYAKEARDRVLASRSRPSFCGGRGRRNGRDDSDENGSLRHRPRRRTQRLYIPLDRSPMSDFDHLLNDLDFDQRVQRATRTLDTVKQRQKGVLRAQQLAIRIGDILAHCQRVFGQLRTLVDQLLQQWEAHRLQCATPDAPLILTQKLAFQRHVKTLLLDVRQYMQQQVVEGAALGQYRCNGPTYHSWFTYQVRDCDSWLPCGPVTDANGDTYTPQQVLLAVTNQTVVRRAKTLVNQAIDIAQWTSPGYVTVNDIVVLTTVLKKQRVSLRMAGGC